MFNKKILIVVFISWVLLMALTWNLQPHVLKHRIDKLEQEVVAIKAADEGRKGEGE